uniref:Apple domain-containing protein n=1 Tax=Onchocerca volvulus TaxID=6282 RepID=A0A8R1TJB9_ONCVO
MLHKTISADLSAMGKAVFIFLRRTKDIICKAVWFCQRLLRKCFIQAPSGNVFALPDYYLFSALGPPRRGLQRAVFDEVLTDELIGEIPQAKNDIDAYDDDSLVDLRGEDPLFIPKPYREGKGEQKMKASTVKAERIRTSSISTSTPFTTSARIPSTKPVGRTSAPVILTMRPSFSPQSPFRPLPTQLPPRREFLSPSTPRIGHRFETDSRASFLVPTRPVVPTTPLSPRIDFRLTSHSTSDSLRTGVCHASIFYISTPTSSSQEHSFTHFAITVSTDQCARTCHEFNCAIAHYDPSTGRCQFNPSTAFSIREGQCPPWPTTHYRNNVQTNTPLRIFCVQCHRSCKCASCNISVQKTFQK